MKIFGYIPIAVVIALFIGLTTGQFVSDTTQAQTTVSLTVMADTYTAQGERLRWARQGSNVTVELFDPADVADAAVIPDSGAVTIDSDDGGETFNLVMTEVDRTLWDALTFNEKFEFTAGVPDNGVGADSGFFVGGVLLGPSEATPDSAAPLATDDDDEIKTTYGFSSFTFDLEDEGPDIDNFEPDDGDVVDDSSIDVSLEITDDDSGLSDPDDFDTNHTNMAILIANVQCREELDSVNLPGQFGLTDPINDESVVTAAGLNVFGTAIIEYRSLNDWLFGPDVNGDGDRTDAGETGIADLDCDGNAGNQPDITVFGIDPDNDIDDIDAGWEVDREANVGVGTRFLGAVAIDDAGNFGHFDVDGGDDGDTFNEITVDEDEPELELVRTGVGFDGSDNDFDNSGEEDWLQLVFSDITDLDADSIDVDDIVVEGHDVRRVVWFDVDPEELEGGPDSSGAPHLWENRPDDVGGAFFEISNAVCSSDEAGNNAAACANGAWLQSGDIFHPESTEGAGVLAINANAFVKRTVFVQLEDEVDSDEDDFDVTVVPNGIDDEAGNTLDGGNNAEGSAEDWIAPSFQVLEMTGGRTNSDGKTLVGEDEEVELIITSDEDLGDEPEVLVTYIDCEDDPEGGAPDCPNLGSQELSTDLDEIGNNRWRVEIDEPGDTGYYNIFISGTDDSDQNNAGDEGVEFGDFFDGGDVDDDAIFFEGDILLAKPFVRVAGVDASDEPEVEFRNPFFVEINFSTPFDATSGEDEERLDENNEYEDDNFDDIEITLFELDGVDLTDQVSTTDDQKFLIAIEDIGLGEHKIVINALDQAGNDLEDDLDLDFEVEERDDFELEVNPGWNLVSLPGDPEDPSIDSVFPPGVPVTTIYSFDPTVPGGWLVAVRETSDDPWAGDLDMIHGDRGYWLSADQIVEVDIQIPRLGGGAINGGTPIQPPTVDLFPGWNLVPIIDVTGGAGFDDTIDADIYFGGVNNEVSRILTFDTITNAWEVVPFFEDPIDGPDAGVGLLDDPDLAFGTAYWTFVTEAATLVPGGE